MEKTMLLASARNLVRNFILKKDKYVAERDEIKNNFDKALEETIKKKIAEMRKKGAAQLEKRLERLNKQIEDMDKAQRGWEQPIIDATGRRAEDIFGYEMQSSTDGKNRLNVFFRYPDTVIPPTSEPECPTHDEAENCEVWDDEAVAAQTSEPKDEYKFEELPTAEVPEPEIPEYDSAGFSTEDGLQEGEPAELEANILEPTDVERELLEQQWEEEEDEDEDIDETDDEPEDSDDDPFFLG